MKTASEGRWAPSWQRAQWHPRQAQINWLTCNAAPCSEQQSSRPQLFSSQPPLRTIPMGLLFLVATVKPVSSAEALRCRVSCWPSGTGPRAYPAAARPCSSRRLATVRPGRVVVRDRRAGSSPAERARRARISAAPGRRARCGVEDSHVGVVAEPALACHRVEHRLQVIGDAGALQPERGGSAGRSGESPRSGDDLSPSRRPPLAVVRIPRGRQEVAL